MSDGLPAPEFGYRIEQVKRHMGTRLKLLRNHNLLFKTTTARLADISVRQYTRFENGDAMPRIHELLALANVFKVNIAYLVMDSGPSYPIQTISQRFADGHSRWR